MEELTIVRCSWIMLDIFHPLVDGLQTQEMFFLINYIIVIILVNGSWNGSYVATIESPRSGLAINRPLSDWDDPP